MLSLVRKLVFVYVLNIEHAIAMNMVYQNIVSYFILENKFYTLMIVST